MDLLKILRSKIDILEEGDYIPGLKAVLLHIETASNHLDRGNTTDDETAFTDAIYRTNQAFEGSLKEAYRVLANKNPDRESPHKIEKFFEENNIFRQRVLAQFTNYRTEWRNPSSHDYKLDFDESESFLAIVSVAAFACLVLDQIIQEISYLQVKAEADTKQLEIQEHLASVKKEDLLKRITEILREFSRQQPNFNTEGNRQTELQFTGQLLGFFASAAPDLDVLSEYKIPSLASAAPDLDVLSEYKIPSLAPIILDLVISDKSNRVIIEIKRARFGSQLIEFGIAQVEHYMLLSNINSAIFYLFSDSGGELEIQEHNVSNVNGNLVILKPQIESINL